MSGLDRRVSCRVLNQIGEEILVTKAVDTEEKPLEEIPLREDDEPTY